MASCTACAAIIFPRGAAAIANLLGVVGLLDNGELLAIARERSFALQGRTMLELLTVSPARAAAQAASDEQPMLAAVGDDR